MKSNVQRLRAVEPRNILTGRPLKKCDRTYTLYQRQQKLLARLRRFFQVYNPRNYRIHMGWFGGLRIYPKVQYSQSQRHEYR
ncbi:MAG: hypothetical protein ACFB2W_24290 [Leptolyngbyaceae cyanobacterium]